MSFARDATFLLVIQAISVLSNTFCMALLSRCVGPEGRGVLAVCTRWSSIWLAIAQMGIASTLLFHWRTRPGERSALLVNAAVIVLVAGSLPLAVLIAAPGIARGLTGEGVPPALMLLAFLGVPITACGGVLEVALRLADSVPALLKVHIAAAIFRVLTSAVLFIWSQLDVGAFLWITLASAALMMGLQGGLLRRRTGLGSRPNVSYMLFLARHGMVQNVAVISATALYALPVILAARRVSLEQAGLLTTGMSCFSWGWMAAHALRGAMQAKLATISDGAGAAAAKRAAVLSLAPFLGASLLLALVGRPLIVLLYGRDFAPAYGYFLAFLPAVLCLGVYTPLEEYLQAQGLFGTVAGLNAISVIAGGAAMMIATNEWGGFGCAAAFDLTMFARLALVTMAFRREARTVAADRAAGDAAS